ncbi:MAG: FMN-binding glutamate synthase family protein [Actinomycetia bacterium]|nr:FMN-binding glutamate synthase family protein [Actinomycetes bacterium]
MISVVGGALIVVGLTLAGIAAFVPALVRRAIQVLLTRPMSDTLAELYLSLRSTPPVDFLYSSLRAATGDMVIRPMGSARPAHGFDDLAFVPAQLARRPLEADEPVDLAVRLGPRAARPLALSMPVYLSGMAYGLALTREARLALATASGRARIPLNSGQGPFLEEERRRADTYVLQFGRWSWNRDPHILRQADMVEVQVGQGAMPGNAVVATPTEVAPDIKRLMGLAPDARPIIHANLFWDHPGDGISLRDLVARLRDIVPDIPIALKLGAGQDLERDLDVALEAGIDVVVVDGTEGATGNAPITLSDHFGIPTLMALGRAVRHLAGVRDRVSLAVSGGFREPGDILKALALGADAVGIGTIAMFALAHRQITTAVPLYPPTDLVFYRARPRIPLDVADAAQGLVNFLESCRTEMAIALRTLGHRSVRELSPRDLCALDPEVAHWTGVVYAGG